MDQRQHFIVTADGRAARLFSCTETTQGELHVEHVRSLGNEHEREHERHRPDLLGGSERAGSLGRAGAAAAPHSVAVGHASEEEQLRFVREMTPWLLDATRELAGPAGRLSVFAAPRLLGLLRAHLNDLDTQRLDLLEGELARMTPSELARHPAVKHAARGLRNQGNR